MDAMDVDIDMDVSVDLVPDEPIAQPQDTPSPGEVVDTAKEDEADVGTIQPTKIYIRGLDDMKPDELKDYVAEHFPSGFDRTEWIDDSSANLVFRAESTAQEALVALASVAIGDVTQLPVKELLPAKSFSKKAGFSLQIRFAVTGDKKQFGAAQRSRFYLFNPEYDPAERKRRYRVRAGEGYERRRGRSSREDEPKDHFDVNLYDDDAAALSTRDGSARPQRRRRSYTPEYDSDDRIWMSSNRGANRSKELFPDHAPSRNGSRRDRSASPARDRNGDLFMDKMSSDGSAARNRRGARAIKERLTRDNRQKELFPSTLFSSERLDDVEELSSKFTLPLVEGTGDPPPKSLADRITAPGQERRLADRITNSSDASGFSIRGAAKQQRASEQGFAIKGNAGKSVKELFPDKFGSNAGKELFSDRLDGRSRRRQKAGDLFD